MTTKQLNSKSDAAVGNGESERIRPAPDPGEKNGGGSRDIGCCFVSFQFFFLFLFGKKISTQFHFPPIKEQDKDE